MVVTADLGMVIAMVPVRSFEVCIAERKEDDEESILLPSIR